MLEPEYPCLAFQEANDGRGFDVHLRSADPDYRFECPDCGTTPIVSERVRDEKLATGCFLCGFPVSRLDFREV